MAFEFGGEPGIGDARALKPFPVHPHKHQQFHLVVGHS